jgi:hypothetical protein
MSKSNLSTPIKTICKCCDKLKMCKLYVIATLEAVWICQDCREGKTSKE